MYTGIYHTHKLAVILFLLIYVIKFILLFVNTGTLDKFSKTIKIPEMIISFLFLATGIYLFTQTSEVTTLLLVKIALVVASIPLAISGFKKHKKTLAVVSVLFIFAAYGMAEMNHGMKAKRVDNPELDKFDVSSADYNPIEHGKVLYLSQCANCHGPSGDLGVSGAKNLKTSVLNTEDVESILNKGKNAMPGYSKTFTIEEIEALVLYVQELKEK